MYVRMADVDIFLTHFYTKKCIIFVHFILVFVQSRQCLLQNDESVNEITTVRIG